MKIKQKYCGYITIVGKVNVGKSTLINKIIGKKISITSRKKNTTQVNVTGIKTEKHHQFIYVDTPGIIFDKKKYQIQHTNNHFNKIIKLSTLIIFVIDRVYWTNEDEEILNKIKKNNISIIIIINKIDKLSNKNILLPFIDFLKKKNIFIEIIPISTKKNQDITCLSNIIKPYLPINPHIYPANYITENSDHFAISEIIRKQLISFLGDELPSVVKVKIECLKKEEKEMYIRSVIFVKNKRQKKIVIGKKGENIKNISVISRYNIEKEYNIKTHLILWVKN